MDIVEVRGLIGLSSRGIHQRFHVLLVYPPDVSSKGAICCDGSHPYSVAVKCSGTPALSSPARRSTPGGSKPSSPTRRPRASFRSDIVEVRGLIGLSSRGIHQRFHVLLVYPPDVSSKGAICCDGSHPYSVAVKCSGTPALSSPARRSTPGGSKPSSPTRRPRASF